MKKKPHTHGKRLILHISSIAATTRTRWHSYTRSSYEAGKFRVKFSVHVAEVPDEPFGQFCEFCVGVAGPEVHLFPAVDHCL